MSETITKEQVDNACAVVLCETLRDQPLWEVIRIVCSVRWGKLGKALAARAATTEGGGND